MVEETLEVYREALDARYHHRSASPP
jgi:hypothetical protein